jgi:hypothetical protein
MSQQLIITTPANSQQGDSPKSAFDKINANFSEVYNNIPVLTGAYDFSGVDSGATNAYVVALSSLLPVQANPPALVAGLTVSFIPLHANTGPSTLNFVGDGAVAIVGTTNAALVGAELQPLIFVTLKYTGTAWQIVSPVTTNPTSNPTFGSIVVGAPTGGNEGAGTVNATNVFVNGVAVPVTQAAVGAFFYPQSGAEAAVPVVPTNYYYYYGDIRRYGATTAATDNTAAIQAAINQAEQVAAAGCAPVRIPFGTWKFITNLVVNNTISIIGDAKWGSVLAKNANVVGLTIQDNGATSYGQCLIQNLSINGIFGGGDASVGVSINTQGHVVMRDVVVSTHGSHGIEILQSTVGRFDTIHTVSNGGDGIKLTGSGGYQANANIFTGVDTRGNTGWGMNFLAANNNSCLQIVAQSNTAGGVQLGACEGNRIEIYGESNTGVDLNVLSTNLGGNYIHLLYQTTGYAFAGGTYASNVVLQNRNVSGALYPDQSNVFADNVIFSNQQQTAIVNGVFTLSHANSVELDVVLSGYSATGLTKFSNSTGGFYHYVQADNFRVAQAATAAAGGNLALGSSTAASATTGASGALPAQVAGYLIAYLGSTAIKIPYYNN